MGSKSKTTNDPWAPAQPFILQGLQNSGRVFDQTQPQLEGFSADQRATYGRMAPGAEAGISSAQAAINRVLSGAERGRNPGAMAFAAGMTPRRTNDYSGAITASPSAGYFKDVMSGRFLNGNPAIDSVIGYAIDDANDSANSAFSSGGRYGSGAHQGVLAREAGRISGGLRMAAYDAERGRMDSAAGMLDNSNRADSALRLQALGADEQARLAASNDALQAAAMADQGYWNDLNREQAAIGNAQDLMRGSQSLLSSAAELPWYGVGALNGNVRQASSGYGTTTTQESGDFLGGLAGLAGTLGGAAIKKWSDKRLKKDAGVVGVDPGTGLPLHAYTYKDDSTQKPQVGVMAQEVEKVAPDAVMQDPVSGFKAVDHGKLGLPDPDTLAQQLPTQAVPKVKHGLGKFLGDITQPGGDANIGGALQRIGESLLVGAGGGWEGIGRGLIGARADAMEQRQFAAKQALEERKMAAQEREADALAAWRQAQMDRLGGPQDSDYARRVRDAGLDPAQGEGLDLMRRMMAGTRGNEPLVITEQNGRPVYTPRSKAAGMSAYRAPARAGGGGSPRIGMSGGVPVLTLPAQYWALPSGATFKAPDGTVRRKP